MGFPNELVPLEIKKQRLHTPFYANPSGKEPIEGHPGGVRSHFSKQKTKRPNQGLRGPSLKRGNPNAQKIKKILELLNL